MKQGFVVWLLLLAITTSWGQQTQAWDTIPRLPDHYKQKLASFKKEKTRTGGVMFLGNSITEVGDFKKLLNDTSVVNRGIGGDITFGIMNRLEEVIRFKPRKLFLLIGINDLSKGIPEDVILENMFMIATKIKQLSPKTELYIQSILPVNPSFKNFPKGYNLMEKVDVINTQLSKIYKRFNYTYVDLYKEFTDQQGFLDAKYSTDGLHLNAAGYQQWIKILKDEKHL